MYCLRYWARYVRKGEVKSRGVQIVLCNSFLYTNNIQKYYSVSRCVISIINVIAPTHNNDKYNKMVFNTVAALGIFFKVVIIKQNLITKKSYIDQNTHTHSLTIFF